RRHRRGRHPRPAGGGARRPHAPPGRRAAHESCNPGGKPRMSPVFAFRYALRNLLRGGQRALLATACVAFGVMSLVGLQLLSATIAATVTADPRALVGGDAALSRGGRPLSPADRAELERLKADGALAAYTLVAERPGPIVQRVGSGRSRFLGQGLGVDPATYPLAGRMELRGAPQS